MMNLSVGVSDKDGDAWRNWHVAAECWLDSMREWMTATCCISRGNWTGCMYGKISEL